MIEQTSREAERLDMKNVLSIMGMPCFSTRMLNSSDNVFFDFKGRVWVGSEVSQEKLMRIADLLYAQPILNNPQNLQNYWDN